MTAYGIETLDNTWVEQMKAEGKRVRAVNPLGVPHSTLPEVSSEEHPDAPYQVICAFGDDAVITVVVIPSFVGNMLLYYVADDGSILARRAKEPGVSSLPVERLFPDYDMALTCRQMMEQYGEYLWDQFESQTHPNLALIAFMNQMYQIKTEHRPFFDLLATMDIAPAPETVNGALMEHIL